MRKIEILTGEEQQAFDDPPQFNIAEQKSYFILPENIVTWAKAIVIHQVTLLVFLSYSLLKTVQ